MKILFFDNKHRFYDQKNFMQDLKKRQGAERLARVLSWRHFSYC
ncbi:hypothetical protein D920_01589 [Enterococcus faecalis 13-SD-W-01]|nr:hypothetical protein D920_01589 [Enterococcus faecalis 13-SD-W-01]